MEITKQWIQKLSDQNDYENQSSKEKYEAIRCSIKEFNLPTDGIPLPLLVRIADWKAARTKGYIKKNDPGFVKEVTKTFLSTTNEQLKLEVLTLLKGVNIRMATAILMFCYPDEYTVMDWRAWKSLENLGILKNKIKDSYQNYKQYNEICKRIAQENGVSLRTLDKALWQWKGGQ